MTTTTLHDETRSLWRKISMLAFHPGYIDIADHAKAREFYEYWKDINFRLIEAGFEDSEGNLSFVNESLEYFLARFPAGQTTVGILEVFPPQAEFSSMVYSWYMGKLEQIATSTPRTTS